MKNEDLSHDRFLRVWNVAEMFGIRPSTVWEWARKGKLPKAVKISTRVSAWRLSELKPYYDKMCDQMN